MAEVSDEYIGYRLEVFIGVFTVVEIIFVALRVYARSLKVGRNDLGDWLVIASLVAQIVAGGIAIGSVKQAGVGYHVTYLAATNPEAITNFFKYLVAISCWYTATENFSKLAICLLYKRIFPQRSIAIIVNVTIGILVATAIATTLVGLFGCTPFSAHWGSTEVQATKCIDTEALFVWGTFPNIVTDIILLITPIPAVWNLNASMGLRVGLVITFAMGNLGLVTSIMRFVAFHNKSSFVDATYHAVELIIWTVCEPGVYLISACLVVYRPLLEKMGISVMTGRTARSSSGGAASGGYIGRKKAQQSSSSGGGDSIGLTTIGGSHFERSSRFERLEDSDERPLRKNQEIRATTSVQVVWDERSSV